MGSLIHILKMRGLFLLLLLVIGLIGFGETVKNKAQGNIVKRTANSNSIQQKAVQSGKSSQNLQRKKKIKLLQRKKKKLVSKKNNVEPIVRLPAPEVRQDEADTCSGEVTGDCLVNAMTCLTFEGNFRNNFNKQYKRFTTFNRTTNAKLTKNNRFEHSAKHMLEALGINSSASLSSHNISCHRESASNDSAKALEADKFRSTYLELSNCSAYIKEECALFEPENGTFEVMDQCFNLFKDTKKLTEACRKMTENSTGQCECWQNMKTDHYDVFKAIKEPVKCAYMSQLQKWIKASKKACVAAFTVCKNYEDDSIELIHDCMDVGDDWNPITDEKELVEVAAAKNLSRGFNASAMNLNHLADRGSRFVNIL